MNDFFNCNPVLWSVCYSTQFVPSENLLSAHSVPLSKALTKILNSTGHRMDPKGTLLDATFQHDMGLLTTHIHAPLVPSSKTYFFHLLMRMLYQMVSKALLQVYCITFPCQSTKSKKNVGRNYTIDDLLLNTCKCIIGYNWCIIQSPCSIIYKLFIRTRICNRTAGFVLKAWMSLIYQKLGDV